MLRHYNLSNSRHGSVGALFTKETWWTEFDLQNPPKKNWVSAFNNSIEEVETDRSMRFIFHQCFRSGKFWAKRPCFKNQDGWYLVEQYLRLTSGSPYVYIHWHWCEYTHILSYTQITEILLLNFILSPLILYSVFGGAWDMDYVWWSEDNFTESAFILHSTFMWVTIYRA